MPSISPIHHLAPDLWPLVARRELDSPPSRSRPKIPKCADQGGQTRANESTLPDQARLPMAIDSHARAVAGVSGAPHPTCSVEDSESEEGLSDDHFFTTEEPALCDELSVHKGPVG